MPTATIRITIDPFTGPFRPGGTSPTSPPPIVNCTVTDMSLDSGPSFVTVTGPGGLAPFTITVTGRQAVRFAFVVVDAKGGAYTERGLVFSESTSTSAGQDNFPSFGVDAGGLAVTDTAVFAHDYEFALLVQNSQYGLGLVDPKISNR